MQWLLNVFVGVALVYTVIVFSVYIFLTLRAVKVETRLFKPRDNEVKTRPLVSILIPSYQEDGVIINTLRAIENQTYSVMKEVFVIDDGSDDLLWQTIKKEYPLTKVDESKVNAMNTDVYLSGNHTTSGGYSQIERADVHYDQVNKLKITVLTMRENSGKAHCLNVGLALVKTPIVYTIDADTILDLSAIETTVKNFKWTSDGLSAMVGLQDESIADGECPKEFINKIQFVEYLRSFILWKTSLGDKDAAMIITGAFGMFRTSKVRSVHGWKDSLGEDMELSWDMLESGSNIQAYTEVLAYTQAPDNFTDLSKQRVRWFRGGHSNMINHKKMLFNKTVRKELSWYLVPFLWFADILGPIVELLGYLLLITIAIFGKGMDWWGVLGFLGIIWCLHVAQMLILMYYTYPRIITNKITKRYRLLGFILLEPFTYHYLHFIWMVKAHAMNYLGIGNKWNKFNRR